MSPEGDEKPAPKKPAKISPHPLVVGLAATMYGDKGVSEAYTIAKDGKDKLFEPPVQGIGASDEAIKTSVKQFLEARARWELVKFQGYLADEIDVPDEPGKDKPERWQVMFLDETAESYVVLCVEDIKFRDRIKDDKAAFGMLDVVWVTGESRVLTGGRMESLLGRFTTGGFLRAGDFRSSMTGGTLGGVSDLGPLCTAFTPCCCNRNSP
jgi:hypothetical protein